MGNNSDVKKSQVFKITKKIIYKDLTPTNHTYQIQIRVSNYIKMFSHKLLQA